MEKEKNDGKIILYYYYLKLPTFEERWNHQFTLESPLFDLSLSHINKYFCF